MGDRFYLQQAPKGRKLLAALVRERAAASSTAVQAGQTQANRPTASKRSKAKQGKQAMAKQTEAGERQAPKQSSEAKQTDRPRMESEAILPAGVRILKGSVQDKDWRGVSKAIWLLEELEKRLVEARERRREEANRASTGA